MLMITLSNVRSLIVLSRYCISKMNSPVSNNISSMFFNISFKPSPCAKTLNGYCTNFPIFFFIFVTVFIKYSGSVLSPFEFAIFTYILSWFNSVHLFRDSLKVQKIPSLLQYLSRLSLF